MLIYGEVLTELDHERHGDDGRRDLRFECHAN